jgi:hypothetical protein
MAFDLANYEPVSSRLARWLQDGQPGTHRVITHLAQYTDERCVFRAELYIDDLLLLLGGLRRHAAKATLTALAILRIAKHQLWAVRWPMLGLLAAITQKGRHARRCLKWNAAQPPTPGLQTLTKTLCQSTRLGKQAQSRSISLTR